MTIHPTALVHPSAVIGEGTTVGAFSIVGESVRMGRNCEIQEHVVLRGRTTLGDEVRVFPFSVVGGEPQHLQYKGEPTSVEIGNRVVLRESVTVHRGTGFGSGITRIGDGSYLMAYCHVAHDCIVGRGVVMANSVHLAGHAEVEDHAVVGGLSGITQYVRVGRYCYIGGSSMVRKDLPPFMAGKGNEFHVQGINAVGMTRQGFSEITLARVKAIFKIFYLQKLTLEQALDKMLVELGETDEVGLFLKFVRSSKMGIIR